MAPAPLAGPAIGWQDKDQYRAKMTVTRAAVKKVQKQAVAEAQGAKEAARARAQEIKLGKAVAGRPRWVKPSKVAQARGDAAHAEDAKARATARRAAAAAAPIEAPVSSRTRSSASKPWNTGAPERVSADEMQRRACLAAREHLLRVEAATPTTREVPPPADAGPRWVAPTKDTQSRGDAALAADAKARAAHRRDLAAAERVRPRPERYEPYPEDAPPPAPQKPAWRKPQREGRLPCDMVADIYIKAAADSRRLRDADERDRQRICGATAFATGNPPLACPREPPPPPPKWRPPPAPTEKVETPRPSWERPPPPRRARPHMNWRPSSAPSRRNTRPRPPRWSPHSDL